VDGRGNAGYAIRVFAGAAAVAARPNSKTEQGKRVGEEQQHTKKSDYSESGRGAEDVEATREVGRFPGGGRHTRLARGSIVQGRQVWLEAEEAAGVRGTGSTNGGDFGDGCNESLVTGRGLNRLGR
jgi:hypothetical protein